MTSKVDPLKFLEYVPMATKSIHEELLMRLRELEHIDARRSSKNKNRYDVFVIDLHDNQHVLRVQGTANWKFSTLERDLKAVWNPEKLGNRRAANEYKSRWAAHVKDRSNPDSFEVRGGLQRIGVEIVIRILTGIREFVRS